MTASWKSGYLIGAGNLELYSCGDDTFTGSGGTGFSTVFDPTTPSPRHQKEVLNALVLLLVPPQSKLSRTLTQ